MKFWHLCYIILIFAFFEKCSGQNNTTKKDVTEITSEPKSKPKIIVGAAQTNLYLNLLSHKKVGIVANQTSVIGKTHLVDSLIHLKVNVVKIFSPEHGFRGNADAGEKIKSEIDKITGLPIISLYGKNHKPNAEQLKDLDVVLFDIQDVGARFYTYISTLHYVMEACAENNKKLIVLDRPNPNGYYVDGPVLEKNFQSLVGLDPIPIVHGLTVGEYAKMVNGEAWLKNHIQCDLTVIKVKNYNHLMRYNLPIAPSPNLPNMSAIYLYPSLCLFEGTPISVGRGTKKPFQIIGHPSLKNLTYSFTPKSTKGAKHPKLMGKKCYGHDLSIFGEAYMEGNGSLNLFWLIDIYKNYKDKDHFFTSSFNLLAGNDKLQQQIKDGLSEEQIKASWQKDLLLYKKMRKKYLLYPDFE